MRRIKKYIYPLLFIIVVAVLGTIFVYSGSEWYSNLNKPMEWPPSIIIIIIWTIIYSLFYVYAINSNYYNYNKLLNLLLINGFLNVLWCFIYFVLNFIFVSLIIIIINLTISILTIKIIYKNNRRYGYMLIIYPLWLCIAITLNLAVWILN